jgi:hypothetical protein
MLDFAENALDPQVSEALDDNLKFQVADLTRPLPDDLKSHFGFCCDVLEHIPEEDIDTVLKNILGHSKFVFFQISCVEDHFGNHPYIKADNEELHLHLTVQPYAWWLNKFAELGCVVHASWDRNGHVIFFVTATRSIYFSAEYGVVNVEPEKLRENIRENAKLGLPAIRPYETQDVEVMLLAGGPSLNDFEDEIIQNRKDGMKLVTVNGSYNWAIDRGLKPSMQVVADSREFNKRFAAQSELTEETRYLINSSADPAVLENLPKDRTYLMHSTLDEDSFAAIVECYGAEYEDVFPVPGGSTVTLRALAALRMIGFYKIHVYGFDSCYPDTIDKHHAYEQPENDHDSERATPITIASGSDFERTFLMAPWHAYQILDFMRVSQYLLHDALIDIKGDGAIAHLIKANAALDEDFDENSVEEEAGPPGVICYTLAPVPLEKAL